MSGKTKSQETRQVILMFVVMDKGLEKGAERTEKRDEM